MYRGLASRRPRRRRRERWVVVGGCVSRRDRGRGERVGTEHLLAPSSIAHMLFALPFRSCQLTRPRASGLDEALASASAAELAALSDGLLAKVTAGLLGAQRAAEREEEVAEEADVEDDDETVYVRVCASANANGGVAGSLFSASHRSCEGRVARSASRPSCEGRIVHRFFFFSLFFASRSCCRIFSACMDHAGRASNACPRRPAFHLYLRRSRCCLRLLRLRRLCWRLRALCRLPRRRRCRRHRSPLPLVSPSPCLVL